MHIQTKLTIEQLIELEAFQTMRKIAKSNLDHDKKQSLISDVFDDANKILDISEGGRE